MSSHGQPLDYQHIASDPRSRMLWWLVGLIVFLAPLPLGSNRPWAWSLFAAAEFLVVAAFLVFSRQAVLPQPGAARNLFLLTFLLAVFPLLQVIPLPADLLQLIGPGSLQAWSLDGATGSAPVSIDIMRTLDIGMRQGAALLLALVMLRLFRYHDVRWQFVNLLVAVGVLNALIGLAMFFTGEPVAGTYVNKNHFAGLMCMVLPLAVAAVIRRQRQCSSRGHSLGADYRFVIFSVSALLLSMALILSGSRGAVAATLLALLVALVMFADSGWRRRKVLVKIILLAVVISLALIFLIGADKVLTIYVRGFSERPVQWLDTLRALPQYWLLGSGVGTYDFVYPAFKSPTQGFLRFDHAHNDYLEFLTTMGVAGFALFGSIVWATVSGIAKKGHRRRGLANNALAFGAVWSVVGALLHAGVDFNLQIPANFLIFFFVLMLLASCVLSLRKRATANCSGAGSSC